MTGVSPTLLGIPFDAASSFQRGPALAPAAIRQALVNPSSNTATEEGFDVAAPGVLEDAGDVTWRPDAEPAEVRAAIEAAVSELLDAGRTPLVLGGDHSITYPVVRAVAARHAGLGILHFDAHDDLYDILDGDRWSHGCPFARIMEERLAARLVQIGIRTLTAHQRDQVARFGVETHEMRHWSGPVTVDWDGPLYVSLDLDVLDPAFIAGINHPEPGGLSVRDVLTMIQRISSRIVGADVVELSPPEDPSPRSALVAAKMVKELTAAIHRNSTNGSDR